MKGIVFFLSFLIIIFFNACAETPQVYQKSSNGRVVSYAESNITPQELAALFENTPKAQQITLEPAQKQTTPKKVSTESAPKSIESIESAKELTPKKADSKPKNPNPIPPEILIESAKSMSQMTQNIAPRLEIKSQDDFSALPNAQNPPATQNLPNAQNPPATPNPLDLTQSDSKDSATDEENPKKNEGIFQVFNKRGMLIYEAHYKNDKLHGIAKIFDVESGALKSEMNFAYGSQEGEMRIYDTKGHLWHKLQYQKGKKHGLAQEFNDKGAVVGEVRYEDNKEVKTN